MYFLIAGYFCVFSCIYSVWAHPVVGLLPIPSSLQKKAAFVCLLDQTKLSMTIKKTMFQRVVPIWKNPKKILEKTASLLSITTAKNNIHNDKKIICQLHYRRMKTVMGFKSAGNIISSIMWFFSKIEKFPNCNLNGTFIYQIYNIVHTIARLCVDCVCYKAEQA